MFRLLALLGNVRKARSQSVVCNGTRKCSFFVANNSSNNGAAHCLVPRLFNGSDHLFKKVANEVKLNLLSRSSSRVLMNNCRGISLRYVVSYRVLVAWKRLSQVCVYNGRSLHPISKIAGAFSLALTRSNLVAPGVFALLIGELGRCQCAQAESFLSGERLYTRAQNGDVYLTAFVMAIFEGIVLLFRAVYLVILFFPCICMAPFADSFGPEFRKTWVRFVHLTLGKAGPAFIKWGQWAATRPDLFPQDMCTELAELHSKAPAHSFAITKSTIESAFGRKLSDIFARFEEEPLASGSVAQVHRAILKCRYPGQEIKPRVVAVKVRHPSIGDKIRRDFLLFNFAAKIAKVIPTLKWLRLDESIQQFAVFMMSQVDLAREAAHLSRFIYNFRRWKDVSFPKPLYPLVHPAVLVETFEEGKNILHYIDQLEGNEEIKTALARIGSHALLKMLLVDNFIHADMHPGNILVRLTDSMPVHGQFFGSRPHVVFLDVGITAELSKIDRVNLLEFFKAVVLRDGRAAAESTLRLSKKQNCPNPVAFIEDVDNCFNFWDSRDGQFLHPGECMQQLLEHVRRHKVNIDGNVCTVMVTTLVLEGWQRKLDPEYNVMQTLQALLFKSDWADSLSYTIEGLMAP